MRRIAIFWAATLAHNVLWFVIAMVLVGAYAAFAAAPNVVTPLFVLAAAATATVVIVRIARKQRAIESIRQQMAEHDATRFAERDRQELRDLERAMFTAADMRMAAERQFPGGSPIVTATRARHATAVREFTAAQRS